MKEAFKKVRTAGTLRVKLKGTDRIWAANKASIMRAIVEIAEDYQAQGYKLTLRQFYFHKKNGSFYNPRRFEA